MNTIEWWTMLPFCLMLLCIAVLPLCASHWWENNVHKLHISLLWSLPTAVYLIVIGMGDLLGHQILYEYVPFIILLLALYIVTGGIHVSGDLPARPHVTTSYLAIGYVLASIMGTTGALSSILDNTPTALAFHTVAMGLADAPSMVAGVPEPILEAIATGAVFFGSMTYIGNGPNLMVKAIAEEHRIEMPSFVTYIFKFSLIVLLPIYVVVQWMFF